MRGVCSVGVLTDFFSEQSVEWNVGSSGIDGEPELGGNVLGAGDAQYRLMDYELCHFFELARGEESECVGFRGKVFGCLEARSVADPGRNGRCVGVAMSRELQEVFAKWAEVTKS